MLQFADLAAWRHTLEASSKEELITREERTLGEVVLVGYWLQPSAHLELQVTHITTLLVIQGLATLTIDDWRSTGVAGHLFALEAHSRLKVLAEDSRPVFIVLSSTIR